MLRSNFFQSHFLDARYFAATGATSSPGSSYELLAVESTTSYLTAEESSTQYLASREVQTVYLRGDS